MLGVIPVVGSRGSFDFITPFDALAVPGVEYTCHAVRRISDYLASNEEPKTLIYEAYALGDAAYEEDLAANAYIASLQSAKGHWLYVPVRYISQYPFVDGVPYRSVMLGISLPAIPVKQNLDVLKADLKALAEGSLGLSVEVKAVETSKISLISPEKHEVTRLSRQIKINSAGSLAQQNHRLKNEIQLLRTQVASLEAYIRAKL